MVANSRNGTGARWWWGLAALALVLLPAWAPASGEARDGGGTTAPEPLHLVVLHTNDVHGQALPRRATWIEDREVWMGGLERVAAYVERVRAEHDGPNEAVLLVDGGDWFQGTPEGRVRGGREFVKLQAALGYDAMALGNHEFDLGVRPLLELLLETGVPAVCANLYDGDEHVGWVPRYRVVERGGLDVAFVGLLTPRTPDITHADARALVFTDPVEEYAKVLDELPDGVDLVVPLTHNGLGLDRELAAAFPDLPLIVGGHSHTYLRDGVVVGGTRIVQAGDKATVVGRVDLQVDAETGRVLSSRSRLIELEDEADPRWVDAELAAGIERLRARTDREMNVVVGRLLADPVPPTPFASGGLGSWIADTFRRFTRADVGLHNRGGIRSVLVEGPVTRRELFEVCPFENTVVSFELTGAELEDCLRRAIESRPQVRIEVSGVRLEIELTDGPPSAGGRDADDPPLRLVGIEVGGEPLDPERRYRVATNSFLADGGDTIFRLERDLDVLDTGVLINELLEQQFPPEGGLRLPADDRFTVRR